MIKIINVSNEFKEYVQDERQFICKAKIALADGASLTVDNEKIMSGGFNFDEGTSSDGSFDIGAAIIGKFTLILDNTDEAFSDYDFTNAVITPTVGLQLSSTIETVNKGLFTVDEASFQGATIKITALDNMTKFEKTFDAPQAFPVTAFALYSVCCEECGGWQGSSRIPYGDFVIQSKPDTEMTYREIISYIAQINGCYAKVNTNGLLELDWYDTSVFEQEANIYGGTFDSSTPYSSGDSADGGNFIDYSSGDNLDGGEFTTMKNYHHIHKLFSQDIATDDVVITGIQVTDSEEEAETFLYGCEGYVLDISNNPFIQSGDAEKVATFLGEKIIGMRFRPLSVSALSDPTIEAGDCAYVSDRKGNSYPCYITNTGFKISGSQTVTCDAKTASRNSAQSGSALTAAIIAARQEAAKKISSYEIAIQQLTNLMTQSFGVYKSSEILEDGSVIYYMHDKPTLAESQNIWKMTANTLTVSNDGGVTWTAGIDSSGNIVVNVLSAIGINADWINAGTIKGIEIIQHVDGKASISLKNNQMEVYSWRTEGDYVGGLGSLYNSDDLREVISMWADYGDILMLGAHKSTDDKTNGNVTRVISIDSKTLDTATPYVLNTTSGTLFPNNPNGGVTVENGFVKSWNLKGWSGTITYGGATLTFNDGLLTGVA